MNFRPFDFIFFVSLVTGLTCCSLISAKESLDTGFTSLFDGKNLEGWDGDPRFWRIENGTIVGETKEGNLADKNTFLIYRGKEFADFELHFSYRVTGYNSGVQYRSVDQGDWNVSGYQCDFEDRWHEVKGKPDPSFIDEYSGMFFDEGGRMFLGQRGDVVIVRTNPDAPGKSLVEKIGSVGDPVILEKHIHRGQQWNEMVVIAKGYQFTHMINGHVMAIGIDENVENRRASGIFAFQLHSGPPMKIELKDIHVRLTGEVTP